LQFKPVAACAVWVFQALATREWEVKLIAQSFDDFASALLEICL
jgi:hypothetical protein